MKKILVIIVIVILSITILLLFTGCWTDAAKAIAPDEAMMGEDLAMVEAQETKEQSSENKNDEKVAEDPENSEMDKSSQPGTLIFDNSNSELGCSVWASIGIKSKDNKNRELESFMILSPSTSYMEKNPTEFNIIFDFDRKTIEGDFYGIYNRKEEGEAFDSAEISASYPYGIINWDADQKVWLFEGDVEMEVWLKIKNKIGSDGDEILYGDASINTKITGKIIGGSGQHEKLDHHGELQTFGESFNIIYEGEFPPATGDGELRKLTIDCWLALPLGETMASRFPQGP